MNKYLIAAVSIIILAGVVLYSENKSASENTAAPSPTPMIIVIPTQKEEIGATISPMQEENGLKVEDLTVGTGAEAVNGKTVTVNYKGTLVNGVQFDSSYDRGVPFDFVLGAGAVIEGWDQGVAGMKVGGKRKLTIPPSLGYGAQTVGTIPANSTLVFEVELLKVE